MTEHRVGFIGLGIMGEPMACRLLGGGCRLTVHSRTATKASHLLAHGAHWADSPAKVAENSDVIFMCVTDTPDVAAVVRGEKGLIPAARPGMIVVDHSTISPTTARELATELQARGALMLDAPVSGGETGAKSGRLSIMVGGDPDALDRAKPLLSLMGNTITHCGPSGSGQLTKLVNQILVSVTNLAVSEALTLAKSGLDIEKTIAALSGGAAGSWQLANLGPKMSTGDFRPGFTIDLQQKDLRLVLAAAEKMHVSLPATSLVHQLFTAAQAAGRGHDGTQALFTVLQRLAMSH